MEVSAAVRHFVFIEGNSRREAARVFGLSQAGRPVLYTRTTDLVQRLQAARRDLALETALAKLDRFELIILDDIAYAQNDQAGTSVLFELIARRYKLALYKQLYTVYR